MRRRAAPSTTRTPLQIHRFVRLQNSPYFYVFKYALAVKQKVWNKAENRERDRLFFSLQVGEGEWEGDCTRSSVLLSLRLYLSYSLGHMLYSYLAIYRFIFRAKNSYRIRLVYDLYQ